MSENVPPSATDPPRALVSKAKVIVGWRELVAFPDWEVPQLIAKLDTGARTSALHVEDLEEADGHVRFVVPVPGGQIEVRAPLVRTSRVRSSTGEAQLRPVVQTQIELAGERRSIEVSLVSREQMLAPVLIGRRALGSRYLVDPRRRYLFGRPA